MSLPASALEHIRHLYSLADKDQKRAFVDWITNEVSAEKPGVLTSVEKAMPILFSVTTCPRCGGTQFVKNGPPLPAPSMPTATSASTNSAASSSTAKRPTPYGTAP